MELNKNTYDETIAFLVCAIDYEKISDYNYDSSSFNLERMTNLLNFAGNPHDGLKTIHVAGTKGKGSTSIMISSILMNAGLKVGLFTSPHLINMEERIKINGKEISREDLCSITGILRPYIEKEREKEVFLSPTYFEVLTAIALLYFKNESVDVAIMEVGLGGRLDSTNIIIPLVSVIASIGYDHMDKLGLTLTEIASEKAGIIKKHVPVVSTLQEEESLKVLEAKCGEKESPLMLVGREIKVQNIRKNINDSGEDSNISLSNKRFGSICDITINGNIYDNILIPIPGEHQATNCACAVAAAEIAAESFPDVFKTKLFEEQGVEIVRSAIKNVDCPSRIEIVAVKDQLIIIDSAHTVESIHALRKTIIDYIKPENVTFIIGLCDDKDLNGILNELLPLTDKIIFTITGNPRSVKPEELLERWQTIENRDNKTNSCYSASNIGESFEIAKKITKSSDLICVTGSTYLAGSIKSLLTDSL